MTVKTLINDAGDERVLIVQRADGARTWRKQWADRHGWGAEGPDCGIYDSSETTEAEARSRVAWLKPGEGPGRNR